MSFYLREWSLMEIFLCEWRIDMFLTTGTFMKKGSRRLKGVYEKFSKIVGEIDIEGLVNYLSP
jgi:hypothetical protein